MHDLMWPESFCCSDLYLVTSEFLLFSKFLILFRRCIQMLGITVVSNNLGGNLAVKAHTELLPTNVRNHNYFTQIT